MEKYYILLKLISCISERECVWLCTCLEEGEEISLDPATPSLDTSVPPILPAPLPPSCVGPAGPIITALLCSRAFLTV